MTITATSVKILESSLILVIAYKMEAVGNLKILFINRLGGRSKSH